jgi:glutamate-1-semialdehyde 2,1-aminomutase
MWIGLGALFLRQMGHALIEPPCHDKEQLLLGYDTRSKSVILALYCLIPVVNCLAAPTLSWATARSLIGDIALQWFAFTALVIAFRVGVLIRKHGIYNATIWFVKLVTDPVTDVIAYYPSALPRRRVT